MQAIDVTIEQWEDGLLSDAEAMLRILVSDADHRDIVPAIEKVVCDMFARERGEG